MLQLVDQVMAVKYMRASRGLTIDKMGGGGGMVDERHRKKIIIGEKGQKKRKKKRVYRFINT